MRAAGSIEATSSGGELHRGLRLRVVVALAVIFLRTAAAQAQPVVTSLAGCAKIAKSGIYSLDAPTVNAAPGDCIIITAANVVLNLNGATLTGGGSGVGVHVASSASNAFIEGRGALISNFTDGIEIDSTKAVVENFTTTANIDAGLFLKSASQAAISNFSANANSNDGVRISKGSYNTVTGSVSATSNGRYGIWLSATNHNNIGGFLVEDNAVAGVYVGCSPNGPLVAPCKPAVPVSKYNLIFDGRVQASTNLSQTYGVVVDMGNDSNRITNVSSPTPFEQYDLDDENHECAHNAWFGHGVIFSASPADCIH